jgi:hypothetical protein
VCADANACELAEQMTYGYGAPAAAPSLDPDAIQRCRKLRARALFTCRETLSSAATCSLMLRRNRAAVDATSRDVGLRQL